MKQIVKKLGAFVAVAALAVVTSLAPIGATSTYAVDPPANGTCNSMSIEGGIACTQKDGSTTADLNGVFKTVVNVLLFIIGALCVIMLIWGGIRYTTSAGNSSHVTAAKNTIMYALIGLVVAFLAFAIVNWVLGAISK